MPTLTIDDKTIDVPAGTTILEAASELGIAIPTLCYLKGYEPSTSCQVCLVKDRQRNTFLPSCATRIMQDMQIDSETEDVHLMRRTSLELLFSDHVGDCLAPCFFACPAHMDIPLMLEQIGEREVEEAIATVKRDIALPAVLGRVCSKPCEKGCRRKSADGAVSVCELKRFVADTDLTRSDPYCPPCKPDSGKQVAIVGAGPTGLSAAYYLQQEGHHCVVFEKEPVAGGRLRTEPDQDVLPASVLDAEIDQLFRVGAELRTGCEIDNLAELESGFAAVLLACGQVAADRLKEWEIKATSRGIEIDKDTLQTSRPNVFAAGSALRAKSLFVRSVADGKLAATAIHQYLSEQPITPPESPFSSRIGALQLDEAQRLAAVSGHAPRQSPEAGSEYSTDQAADQADRCFSCGCISHGSCKFERLAIQYGADPTRFAGPRRAVEVIRRPGGIQFEPHKCIKCELCIQIAARGGESLGLAFVGRGFDVELGVPFNHEIEEGIARTAAECVAACPTGALVFARHHHHIQMVPDPATLVKTQN
jgi:NADPH-dependent glutamate synthase beta subunit-like oxidoreductase/ferredoxin